ncbi:hypothetical protein [Acetobacter oeni]|uniref:Uncharacterized protein n=1 Tax=Acetobacter oeni TaxID=304077 RepID=A0A511XMR6_9PROT|nr:hypothetical protein [Acetobacter oeni]MBB3882862.1 hypothetical protein [Acetobacter oeni]NHO18948.1 hypothetical protein [Acetobacter oeni]GBR01792.1 hypothetical protein AA21952_0532 [Acetobacter oeni LMG 21952]GEN64241.1 hypothetical protein AOE01nite_24650 [Acetobacter oeni]
MRRVILVGIAVFACALGAKESRAQFLTPGQLAQNALGSEKSAFNQSVKNEKDGVTNSMQNVRDGIRKREQNAKDSYSNAVDPYKNAYSDKKKELKSERDGFNSLTSGW